MKLEKSIMLTSLSLGLGLLNSVYSTTIPVTNFDGTNDHILVSDINAIDGIQKFTVEAYVKWDALDRLSTIFSKRAGHSDKIQCGLGEIGNTDDLMFQIGKDGTLITGYTTGNIISIGNCYHVAYVYDATESSNATKVKIYVNGVLQTLTFTGTCPTTTDVNSASVVIGAESTSPTVTNLDGTLDEVRLWTTARTLTEINDNKNTILTGSETGLLAYWNFDSNTANDVTSNNYDGTLVNGAFIANGTCGLESTIPPSFTNGDPSMPGTGANNGNGGTDFTSGIETLGSIGTQGGTTAMSLLNVNSSEQGSDYIAKYDLDCNGQTNIEVCFNVHSDWLQTFNGNPATELRIAHNNVFLSGNVITSLGNGNYKVCGTAPSCSPFFVQDQDDTPLYVSLSHFSLKSNSKSIQLNWTTESEAENLGFKVYRATGNSTDFRQIASYTYTPELKGSGNSAVPRNYIWEDTEVEFGTTYTYFLSDVDIFGTETLHSDRKISGTLQKEDNSEETVRFVYELRQNFPNPFNPTTTISYTLAKTNDVKLEVFNTKGELVRALVSENQTAGSHTSVWNGKDKSGNLVSSGVYFYKLTAGNYTKTNKMILLK